MAKIICAWCGRVLNEGEHKGVKGEPATHVICKDCYESQSRSLFPKEPFPGEPFRLTSLKFCRYLINVVLAALLLTSIFLFAVAGTEYLLERLYGTWR